jgi:hypothetical protein
MTTKPLDQQLYEHMARKKQLKQQRIDRTVKVLDHTVTALQLIVGTIIAVHVVSWVERVQPTDIQLSEVRQ